VKPGRLLGAAIGAILGAVCGSCALLYLYRNNPEIGWLSYLLAATVVAAIGALIGSVSGWSGQ
jgi:hypothetical protein